MSVRGNASGNAVALHIEPFVEYAFGELQAAPLIKPGQCFRPGCGAAFDPNRPWQIYCSAACREVDTREARSVGHKVALPLLAWRIGKYSDDPAIAARTRAARRYVTQVQSDWLADRRRRAGEVGAA